MEAQAVEAVRNREDGRRAAGEDAAPRRTFASAGQPALSNADGEDTRTTLGKALGHEPGDERCVSERGVRRMPRARWETTRATRG